MSQNNSSFTLPAADVNFKGNHNRNTNQDISLMAQLSYPVNLMESDKRDCMISLRSSVIKDVEGKLGEIVDIKFPWHEILLGAGLTFLGIVFGYFGTGTTDPNVWTWSVFPVLSATCLVSYFFLRHWDGREKAQVAAYIIERLPTDEEIRKAENETR